MQSMADLAELTPADRAQILALVGASMGWPAPFEWAGHEATAVREETRLKFNALVPVTTMVLKLAVVDGQGRRHHGEAEVFFWERDGQWELTETAFADVGAD
jgi:hypothetical protein